MQNLDLNNYGVQEMNAGEMKKTDGGFPWLAGLLVVAFGIMVIEFIHDVNEKRQFGLDNENFILPDNIA